MKFVGELKEIFWADIYFISLSNDILYKEMFEFVVKISQVAHTNFLQVVLQDTNKSLPTNGSRRSINSV